MTNRVINSKIYVEFSFKIVRLERIFDGHDRKIFVGGISDCVGSYGGDIGEKHCVIIYDKSSKKYCIKMYRKQRSGLIPIYIYKRAKKPVWKMER